MELTDRFGHALNYAFELHKDQRRKGKQVPYLSHVLAVAAIVMEHGTDEDEAIAALLHDAVEDQGGPPVLKEIRRRFGERVAATVAGCSDTDVQPKPPWKERKEHHLAALQQASDAVLLVTAADKLHNARSVLEDYQQVGESLWQRFRGGREGTLWYYRSVLAIVRDRCPSVLTEELERVVQRMEWCVCHGGRDWTH